MFYRWRKQKDEEGKQLPPIHKSYDFKTERPEKGLKMKDHTTHLIS